MIIEKILVNGVIPAIVKKNLGNNKYRLQLEGEKWEVLSDFLLFVFDRSDDLSIDLKAFETKILLNETICYDLFTFKKISKQALDIHLSHKSKAELSTNTDFYAVEFKENVTYVSKQTLLCLVILGKDLYRISNDTEAKNVIETYLHFKNIVLQRKVSDYLLYKTVDYVTEQLSKAKIKYELSSFPSGAAMIDIWKGDDFYVVQMSRDGIGLSVVDEDEFSSVPDQQYYDFEAFKTAFEKLLI